MNERVILSDIKDFQKALFRYINKDIEKSGNPLISPTQFKILNYLMKNKDKEVYQKDLENIMKIRRSTVCSVVKSMEKNNLIKRENKGKIYKIITTDYAEDIYDSMKSKFDETNKLVCKGITEEELKAFHNVIFKMIDNISEELGNLERKSK